MEKDIIYIAGNPNAYPLEYYDRDAQSYAGVIPELLERFSEQSRYEVRYYAPEKGDQRAALAASQQVDIISCPEEPGAVPHRAGEDILLLEDAGDGQAAVLCLLDVAPGGLAGDLRAFLSGVSRQEMTALVIQTARGDPPQSRVVLRTVFGGLVLAAALLAAALIHVLLSHRRKLRQLRQNRETDPVTGIGNRAYLERCCQTYLNDRNRLLYTMFCFCFDPKAAASGEDETTFPRHMAVVLQDCASDTDLLARVSDNGFALLRLTPGSREAVEWLATVLDRLREEGSGQVPRVTAGIYPLKPDDRDLNEIIFRGLRAAQTAWQNGTDFQFFGGEILQAIQQERQLRGDAQAGLNNREFQLYLQFYADARTGRAAGAEVLVFWEHPEKGLLPASLWRPLLEQEGLEGQMDSYVLERACAFLDFLRQKGREDFFLLYSLSGQSLSCGAIEEQWKAVLEGYRFDCGRLLFGVPQGIVLEARDEGRGGVDTIRSLGMGLVLDEFDGQMAGLAQAGDAGFCGVKLGRELARQTETPSGSVVLEAVVRAGHALDLSVLAADVETENQAERLRELGCSLLRGDLYAHPLPSWEAMKKLIGPAKGKETVYP